MENLKKTIKVIVLSVLMAAVIIITYTVLVITRAILLDIYFGSHDYAYYITCAANTAAVVFSSFKSDNKAIIILLISLIIQLFKQILMPCDADDLQTWPGQDEIEDSEYDEYAEEEDEDSEYDKYAEDEEKDSEYDEYIEDDEHDEKALLIAKNYLQAKYPYSSFEIMKSDWEESMGCLISSDGNRYQILWFGEIGYEMFLLFSEKENKVIKDWTFQDGEDEKFDDQEYYEKACMARTRLESLFPGSSFILNEGRDFYNNIAYIVSRDNEQFRKYAVSMIDIADGFLICVHDMQTEKLVDSFVQQG